jgi:thymidylate synthase (FAD)
MFAFAIICDQALAAYRQWQDIFRNGIEADINDTGKMATIAKKRANEAARSVLPNAAETRLVWTMNMRAARHVIALRGAEGADLEIRRLAIAMYEKLSKLAPHIFADISILNGDDGFPCIHAIHPKV